MLLREFLDKDHDEGMLSSLRQQVMDYLTPLVAHDVDSVSVQSIVDELTDFRSGLEIDRALVMQIMNPETMKLVKRIDGDTIYLNIVAAMQPNAETQDQKERDAQTISNKAVTQAKKELGK